MDLNENPYWPDSALREDSLFQALIRTAVDGIMVIDQRGTVQVYNEACMRLFQYGEDEVLGRNVKMLMPEPYRAEHDGYIERYRQTSEPRIVGIGREVSGQRKDGTTFPMYLSVGEGQLNGTRVFVGIVHDLSGLYGERAAFEARLLTLREELVRVARVSELGQVSAGIAHELNQPLAAILNYSNAVKRLAASGDPSAIEKIQALTAKIAEQAERSGHIIRHMRDFVENRTGKREILDVVAVAEDAMALGLIGAKSAKVRTSFTHEPGLPAIMADRVQIQQVLVNLLRNAVESMATTARRDLTISVARRDGAIEVSVCDTGTGIPESIAGKLFQPFVTTKPHGMGIGLAISKSIIEAHGGTLTAGPNPGGGTVFRFTLPVANG